MAETAENLCLGFGCRGKGFFAKVSMSNTKRYRHIYSGLNLTSTACLALPYYLYCLRLRRLVLI